MAAALGCAAPVLADAAPRFTLTRNLPDGRVETRSVSLDELRAMSRPAAPVAKVEPAPDPHAVVFALPAPIPDALARGPAAAEPAAPPVPALAIAEAAHPSSGAPSAAAIRAARAAAGFEPRPSALAQGWMLVGPEAGDTEEADAASAAPLQDRASLARKAKGGKPALGVRDGRSFGEQGRFYLYAGVKNRGVGLNLTDHNGEEAGGWGSDGVSYDRGGFAGQRSAGVGWRQGDVSTSLGWVHEKTNVKMVYGAPAEKDDRVALTFTWRPSVKAR